MSLRAKRILLLFPVILAAAALPAAPPSRYASDASAPAVAFETSGLVVTGATPGQRVIVFGFERQVIMGSMDARNAVAVRNSDSAGAVRFDFTTPIPASSIYAVVDYASGRYTVATPEGFPLRLQQLARSDWKGTPNDDFDHVDLEMRWVEALCVRPGVGAWHVFTTDGAGLDLDRGVNGKTLLGAAQMNVLLGDMPSPRKFKPHDVVILIHPHTMEVVATEVQK